MRNILKLFKFKIIAFVVLISLIPCYKISANENNISVNGVDYTISAGEMVFRGDFYRNNVNLITLMLEGPNIDIDFDMMIPNNTNRLVPGTYRYGSFAPFAFPYSTTFLYNDISEVTNTFDIRHGTVVVSVAGSGNNAIYTITIDCALTDENGNTAGTIKGTYQGTLAWSEKD